MKAKKKQARKTKKKTQKPKTASQKKQKVVERLEAAQERFWPGKKPSPSTMTLDSPGGKSITTSSIIHRLAWHRWGLKPDQWPPVNVSMKIDYYYWNVDGSASEQKTEIYERLNEQSNQYVQEFQSALFHGLKIGKDAVRSAQYLRDLVTAYEALYKANGWSVDLWS